MSVVLSVSVQRAVECQKSGDDVFCAVCLSSTLQSAKSVQLEKAAFGGNASHSLADPCLSHFLEHSTTVHVL